MMLKIIPVSSASILNYDVFRFENKVDPDHLASDSDLLIRIYRAFQSVNLVL